MFIARLSGVALRPTDGLHLNSALKLPSILKTHFQEKSVVPAGSSPVILVFALNGMKNQLLTFLNKSITLEQLSAI